MMRHLDVLPPTVLRAGGLARRFVLASALAASVVALLAGVGWAQNADPADLPITRVVLFSSGVGYFEHTGTIDGDRELVLDVPDAQMDDLLQSLVVQDFGGGTIRPVSYPSRDPLARILAGYPLDLSGNPSLASLLVQARGEVVEVEAGETLRGAIVSVEQRSTSEGPETDLTLATDTGLRRVALAEVLAIRFDDPDVRAAFDAALAAIAEHRGDDTRRVRLRFEGEGRRAVRVGYVREMPVWKTSYRLVLDADAAAPGTAELQGWAIVDNPTDQPLENVQMAFVAGQPLAFVTALYDPVYVDRPRVEIDTSSVAPPRADTGAVAPSARMAPAADALFEAELSAAGAPSFAGGGVEAMAQGVAAGPTFSYVVDGPVSVGRHASAMIPILRASVPATTVAWHDAGSERAVALRATEVVNATELHLAPGTVTVFGAQGFLGNARLAEALPGERRLLGYAVEPAVRVAGVRAGEPERVTAVRLVGASIETTIRQRSRTTYTLQIPSGSSAPATAWIDHPTLPGFDVVAPAPAPARTEDGVRIGVAIGDPVGDTVGDGDVPIQATCVLGEACEIAIVEERLDARRLAVANLGGERIAFYLENVELSPADRAVLERVQALQRELARIDRELAAIDTQIRAIVDEQQRIRQNMGALDRNSSLYRRYVRDLEAQEDELDALQASQAQLRDARTAVQADLDDVISTLDPGSTN